MKTGGSHGKGQVEIVRYKANVSVDLRGPALPNGGLFEICISEGKMATRKQNVGRLIH